MIRDILKKYAAEMDCPLSDENIRSIELYAAELKKWNGRLNLTAITKESEIAIRHFIDSLQLVSHISDNDYLLDIGSGAGFPVIPVKIARPETMMLSVDSVAKKINFQRHIIRLLGLSRIEAMHIRVEDMKKIYGGKFSVITSRAFARLDLFVSLAAPLLTPGGRLIAMKGEDVEDEIETGGQIIQSHGFTVSAIHRYNLPSSMGKHTLLVLNSRE